LTVTSKGRNVKRLIVPALIAGVAGGLAEMAWIAFYSSASSTSGIEVARQVTASVYPAASNALWAPWAGAGLHMLLSAVLGLAFVLILWRSCSGRPSSGTIWTSAVVGLSAIWAINFFIVLPAMNSSFATLMPYGVTLLSKTLFGVAMAAALHRMRSPY
jgi:hypothetical protein